MGAGRTIAECTRTNVRPAVVRPKRLSLRKLRVRAALMAAVLSIPVWLSKIADPNTWKGLQPLWQSIVHHSRLVGGVAAGLAAAFVGVRYWKPIVLWLMGWWMGKTIGHRHPHGAGVKPGAFRILVSEDRIMLGKSIRDLGREAQLPLLVAWYICESPHFLPRPEVIERICAVLLTSLQHLRDGSGYGKGFTVKRLLRYHDLNVCAYSKNRIRKSTERARSSLLWWTERRRRKQLGLPLRNS
jgi:hypothetical protein